MVERKRSALLIVGVFVIAGYLSAYTVLYCSKSPAANMAYFVYTEHSKLDHALYWTFWPIYKFHGLVLGQSKHNLDRPTVPLATEP